MVLKCRSCLVKVESQDSVNIFTTTKAGQLISDFLISLAPIQILNNDGFPTNLCRSCEEKVNVLVDFRTLLMTSDAELRKMRNTGVTNENQTLIKEEILEVYLDTEEGLEEKYDRNQTSGFCCGSPTRQGKQSKSRMKDNENIESVDPLFDCPLPITKEDLLQNLVKEELMNEDFLLEDETTETITDLTEEQMEETASCSKIAFRLTQPVMSHSGSKHTEIEQGWESGCSALIPEKSKDRYENTYKIFKKWCENKNKGVTEKVLLAYLIQRNEKLKSPGSLWAEYSMLKCTIFVHDSIDISKFSTLIAYLKRKNVGYRPKKASAFTKEDMSRFLSEAPDEKFLIHKVGMILGVAGACRREELYKMSTEDIEDHGAFIIVKVPNTKNNIQRTFTVTNKQDEKIPYLDIFHRFMKLRPSHAKSKHLFLNYRNGKCNNQVVGKGTIGSWPSKIAEYLKLQDPTKYNGHSFRRTSATLLANKGVDVLG